MSNYLAIATVTNALQQILQIEVSQEIPGVKVTTVRPDRADTESKVPTINIFLYQISPNPNQRNADLRTRRPKGNLIKHGQAALDLYYLFSFYGNELELEPQRLAGSTVRTLVDRPMLGADLIEQSLARTKIPGIEESTLIDQVQAVKIIPETITADELTRIWSLFAQAPYALSFPYRATAVLIQGEKGGQRGLPVLQQAAFLSLERPVLEEIEHHPKEEAKERMNTITLDSCIVLSGGKFLGSGEIKVQIGKAQITPQIVEEAKIEVDFGRLSEEEQEQLRGGMPGIQVVRLQPDSETERMLAVDSNLLPFTLCPQVLAVGNLELVTMTMEGEVQKYYRGVVTIELDLYVEPRQRVFLVLNHTTKANTGTQIFRASRPEGITQMLEFPVKGLEAGDYLLRVQVDGAESPLQLNEQKHYSGPIITVS